MKVVIINPIPYTAETKYIRRAESIRDTMIYDLCLAFQKQGHDVTLFLAEPYQPVKAEDYPFSVVWAKSIFPVVFMPHRFPVLPEAWQYVRQNREKIDLIISSEVFSANTLMAYLVAPDKTLIWHELAKHNAMLKKIPSRIWYNVIARIFLRKARVVARSEEAREFIRRYCGNVADKVIDHGVNLDKFRISEERENYFVVCSQLIPRKRIDGILRIFSDYRGEYDPEAKLYIIGDGESAPQLQKLVAELGEDDQVCFLGRMPHEKMIPILAKAQALLVNTEKDNSMISIVESIALGVPVVTTDVPLNAAYIRSHALGIAKPKWDADDLREIVRGNRVYRKNCEAYRDVLSTKMRVEEFCVFLGQR